VGHSPAFADKKENTMLVWAGDQDHQAPDFVAVIDFDRDIISTGPARPHGFVLIRAKGD
jgi:hypothetical protein